MLFALQLFVLKSLETYALLLLVLIDISTAFFYVLAQNSFSILHKEYVNTYVCNSFILILYVCTLALYLISCIIIISYYDIIIILKRVGSRRQAKANIQTQMAALCHQ